MLIGILTLAIIVGLFFRSIGIFMFGLGGLLFLIYPAQIITILFIGGAIYLFTRSDDNDSTKLPTVCSRSDRDSDQ